MAPPDERTAFAWLLGFVRPHGARLTVVFLLSLTSTGLGLAQPYITKFLIDDGLLAGHMDVVLQLCGLMLAVGIGSALLGAVNRWHYVDVSARILHALRAAVYRHLQRLPPTFYTRTRGGDLLARLDGDIAEVQRFAVDSMLALLNGLIALIGALILMFSLSWQLSMLALVLLPAQFFFLRTIRPRIEHRSRSVRERASAITAFFFDTLMAMKFIQSVAAEEREARRLGALQDAFRADTLRLQMTSYTAGIVPGLMGSLSTAAVFVAGGYWVIQGQFTLGALIAFSAYLARASGPLQSLLGLYVAVQRARVSLARVREITRVEPAVAPPAEPRPLPAAARGEIRFEGVDFRYQSTGPNVLERIDILIPAGAKAAITGVSGVGKSTLIDLLHRHYDPSVGRICIDGIDLRQLDLGELRRRIAVVAQDTVLFAGSLLDNIRYAAPDSDDEQVREAAALARVDAFAAKLPQGYQTDIGTRGMSLSGGQRQRLAIARALLQDPLVLVLDEATSAVDLDTETEIIAAIDRLFADRTRLIISHRPQTVAEAELILTLAGGRLMPVSPGTLSDRP